MITVDIVRAESLYSGTGPATILRKIIDNKDVYANSGIDVSVFTTDNMIPVEQNIRKDSSSIKKFLKKRAPKLAVFIPIVAKKLISRRFNESRSFIEYYISLARTPDIIEFESTMDAYFYLLNSRRNASPKIVVFHHDAGIPLQMYDTYYPCLHNSKFRRYLFEIENYVANGSDMNVFITTIGKINFSQYFPAVKNENMSVVVNGIDDLPTDVLDEMLVKRAKSGGKKYRLCCSGTISKRKGQYLVVEALRLLEAEKLRDIYVTFIGDGPDRRCLEKIVSKEGLSSHVTFTGRIDNSRVVEYLSESNIYILMSANEGLPISILEAMRCYLPIISTNVSGIPETVESGYNGVLVDPTVKSTLNILENLDKLDLKKMGENSRTKFVNQFTLKRNQEDYCKMIHSVASV